MNGVHDLGGVHGLGHVEREENEPVFHTEWERHMFGIYFGTVRLGLMNADEFRHGIERMNPVHYLASRYYEHWLATIERNLIEKGIVDADELEARTQEFKADPTRRPPSTANPELTERVRKNIEYGRLSTRREVDRQPQFQVGDEVVARSINPKGHTRLPRYARGRRGRIDRVYGAFVFPDTNAHGLGEQPQYLYSVRFSGAELWGDAAEPDTVVYLDMWESYLDPA